LSDVLAFERALVVAATAGTSLPGAPVAVLGAVASRYLAVGTPRSFAIVGASGADSLAAHRTWFAPRDVRCTDAAVAALTGGHVVTLAEALAADIVCIHAPMRVEASQLRRGTHVNALAPVEFDGDLLRVSRYVHLTELAKMAAGFVDGRALDEITIFNSR
jgi:ornithine cyclodeaminase/alanine dehydrogenase-like protein (mu-crystallin family)